VRGTNERRSVVDEGWEPMERSGPRVVPLLLGFAAAFLVLPAAAFGLTYWLVLH
jgi:hypothetical protein